jgi:predicted nuclease of predicted toxin-antitoxin system
VKIKLDEGLPASLAERLAKHGIDADTVFAENLAGHTDPEVLAAAVAEQRIVFTLDRGFGNIRAYPPGSHSGIVVFRLDDQSARAAIAAVEDLITHLDLSDLAGAVTVAHRGLLRIRRGDD